MFRAIGTVVVLWYLSTLLVGTFYALDRALVATFGAIETAAYASQKKLSN